MWRWLYEHKGDMGLFIALLSVGYFIQLNWSIIVSNAEGISALSTVAATFLALIAVMAAIYQTKAGTRQAQAAETAINEMKEDRRAEVRPFIVPHGFPNPAEPGIVHLPTAAFHGFHCVNEGRGPALNGVIRLLMANTLYETEFGFLGASRMIVNFAERVTEWPNSNESTMLEAVYYDLYNHPHRTVAAYVDGEWRQLRFDNGGSRVAGKFLAS